MLYNALSELWRYDRKYASPYVGHAEAHSCSPNLAIAPLRKEMTSAGSRNKGNCLLGVGEATVNGVRHFGNPHLLQCHANVCRYLALGGLILESRFKGLNSDRSEAK